jgi:hypothetical protein|tara:strand:+ start:5744 stop:6067 length:324 start_codon:yes stop_codon:yes gene_type:complete
MEFASPIIRFKDVNMGEQGGRHDGKQAILDFGKYQLSIICNEMSYGGKAGLYEIGVFKGYATEDEKMVPLPGITNDGDAVAGHLTSDNVNIIMQKMFLITKNTPVQL